MGNRFWVKTRDSFQEIIAFEFVASLLASFYPRVLSAFKAEIEDRSAFDDPRRSSATIFGLGCGIACFKCFLILNRVNREFVSEVQRV